MPLVHPKVPPRFHLTAAQEAVGTYKFPRSVLRRAMEFMEVYDDEARVIRHAKRLICSLTWADFAWRDIPSGGDVYAKRDKFGLWYVKLAMDGRLRVMSVHGAEDDMELWSGETLRRMR